MTPRHQATPPTGTQAVLQSGNDLYVLIYFRCRVEIRLTEPQNPRWSPRWPRRRHLHCCSYIFMNGLGILAAVFRRDNLLSRVCVSFQREHFGRRHYRPAVNCLVNYGAGVITPDLYITGSGDCVCLVNLIKQQVQNQVIWLWCAPCENDNQTKILIPAAFTYFCMRRAGSGGWGWGRPPIAL